MTALLVILLLLIAAATVWHFAWARGDVETRRDEARREVALRIETARAVQRQRAREDAAGVAESAAQDRPKRKHRKKTK